MLRACTQSLQSHAHCASQSCRSFVSSVRANRKRVLEDLHKLRQFGAVDYVPHAKGGDGIAKGVVRPALTSVDIAARQWLMERARSAGLVPEMDKLGTTIARGSSRGPRLLVGSHSDTQPTGGWLDGALGVIYALEAARAVAEAGGPSAIDVINFQDEEGRFGSLVGSTAFIGGEDAIDFDAVSSVPVSVAPKLTLSEAIRDRGLDHLGLLMLEHETYGGFFEAHIEQGRRLERAGSPVAVVSSIVGNRQLLLEFHGEQNHAGTTTMADRKDAAAAAFHFASEWSRRFDKVVQSTDRSAVWTIGKMDIQPGAASIVPGFVRLVLQFRDPHEAVLDLLQDAVESLVVDMNANGPCMVKCRLDRAPITAVNMDSRLQQHIRFAADGQGDVTSYLTLHSGAIHDAGKLASCLPSAMLFVPSINGVSHDFTEDTKEDDIAVGVEVYVSAAARMVQDLTSD